METRVNFVECLQIDVVMSILTFLDDPADLIRASAVSHSWRNFVIAHSLCKKLCLRKAPPLSNICRVVEEEEDRKLIMNAAESSYSVSSKVFEREHKMYSSLLQALANSMISPEDCIGCVIGASSTDEIQRKALFILCFHLTAFWEPGSPVYSATSVRFRMGHPKSQTDLEVNIKCLPLQQLPDNKYVWTYTSPEFPMSQEYCSQPFKLPEPALCIGGFLLIELLGRDQKEEVDGLYYFCIGSIEVLGRPLKPAFELLMDTTEELLLKYCPDALFGVLQNSSHPRRQLPHQPKDTRLSTQTDALFQRILAPHWPLY